MKRRPRFHVPTPIVAALVATMVLLGTYLATAAPDLTFWDASEFIAAAHTLGIPHPPGTPVWVLLGKVATLLFSQTTPPRAVTLLSVWAAALTGGLSAWLAARWVGGRGAVVAAVIAGTTYSIWLNATESEVYAVALLVSVAMLAAGEWAGRPDASDTQRERGRALIAFLVGLAVPLHLSVLVALPAAIAFAWGGARPRPRELLAWGALAALGFSAVALLPLFSANGPMMDSGHPVTLRALLAVLRREQYQVAGLWPRLAPLWLQLGNVFQWADWQFAFGAHPFTTPSLARTSVTVVFALLGALGLRALYAHEARVARAMALLLLSGTFGVALWLNMRAGPSFGAGVLPAGATHEARERDYFFVLGFWAWGMLAGVGAASLSLRLRERFPLPVALLPLLVALVPLFANRPVVDRTGEPVATLPRTYARLLLDGMPPNGVLLAGGDNDTFPMWYLQQVEERRPDVTVVTVPLLGAPWYRAELVRRGLLAPEAVAAWPGLSSALASLTIRATQQRRPIRVSTMLDRRDRLAAAPRVGWALEGLVWRADTTLGAGRTGLDLAALRRANGQVPRSALTALPPGGDPAAALVQTLLRCTAVTDLADTLLVSGCGGI
ncbi:MAG: DUF2723 domain-containing protein [Gemmatimonadaceae bacterium]|nr:DUF2723 domain-containing protein [Gemmatimonadaceae bacterium]